MKKNIMNFLIFILVSLSLAQVYAQEKREEVEINLKDAIEKLEKKANSLLNTGVISEEERDIIEISLDGIKDVENRILSENRNIKLIFENKTADPGP